jgi:uncharacterized phiE125 gp8 family phage protein
MGLRRLTAPTEQVLTTSDLMQQLSLLDDANNDYLNTLLDRATEAAENECQRAFLPQQWRLTLDEFCCNTIRLPRAPLLYNPEGSPARDIEITYTDENGTEQNLDSELFIVAADSQPARIEPAYNTSWPATRRIPEAVAITYWSGYGEAATDVPKRARQAVAVIVAEWYKNREYTMTGASVASLPLSAKWLLDGLKLGVQPGWYALGN